MECKKHNIEHRLITKPYHPQTNGMIIERFNGRIVKAIKEYKAFKGEFKTQKEMFDFIIIDVSTNYNNTNLQCLNYKTPLEMLNEYLNKDSDVEKDNDREGQNT